MTTVLSQYGIFVVDAMLTNGSPLIDAGFVDPDGLTATRQRIEVGNGTRRDREVFDVLALDLAIEAFTGEQRP